METTYSNSGRAIGCQTDNGVDVSPLAASTPPAVSPPALTASPITANAATTKPSPRHGNINRGRTGSRLRPLAIGELPKPLRRVERSARDYRRYLETACQAVHGDVLTTEIEHLIDEAVGLFIHDATCRWLLKHKFETLSPSEVRANSKERTEAKAARNKIIAKLKLGSDAAEAGHLPGLPSHADLDRAEALARERAASPVPSAFPSPTEPITPITTPPPSQESR